MMQAGEIIDGRFEVTNLCSAAGGMGAVMHIEDLQDPTGPRKVLKYCREQSPDILSRFKREARLMQSLSTSPSVVTVHHCNTDHVPPYFVMDYFAHGHIGNLAARIQTEPKVLESAFTQMLDCVEALHQRRIFHRDIKPQNFLYDDDRLVISDFGLSMEVDSRTRLTESAQYGGTPGYLPPECAQGGFKHFEASGDIYMLGKSFYVLLTNSRDPSHLHLDDPRIPPQLRPVLERCCRTAKDLRYQSIDELRRSLVQAFDAMNGRISGQPHAFSLLEACRTTLENAYDFKASEVIQLIEAMQGLGEDDTKDLCMKLPGEIFPYISLQLPEQYHLLFLARYKIMVGTADYSWSYAETVALHMKAFFNNRETTASARVLALRIAIEAAHNMHRFAAMDACMAMVQSVTNGEAELAQYVSELIQEFCDTFIANTERGKCKSVAVRNALFAVNPNPD